MTTGLGAKSTFCELFEENGTPASKKGKAEF